MPKFQLMTCRLFVTQDAISRVQDLEAAGRLTGVMDDRGKVGARKPLVSDSSTPRSLAVCCRLSPLLHSVAVTALAEHCSGEAMRTVTAAGGRRT